MDTLALRLAVADDAAKIVQLWLENTHEVAKLEPIYTPALDQQSLARDLQIALAQEKLAAFVIYQGDALAAYASFRLETSEPQFVSRRYLYVIDVDVAPAFRQQGLSRKLMTALEKHAVSLGISRLELSVMAADARARTVWERHGFKPHLLQLHKDL